MSQISSVDFSPRTGKASPGKIAVLFDGACAMCRTATDELLRFDNSDSLELLDLHDSEAAARFPALSLDRLMEELHVVDDAGNVYSGARAINEILRHQRGLQRYLAYLWYVPGFPWIADRQYKRVAASRYKCARESLQSTELRGE